MSAVGPVVLLCFNLRFVRKKRASAEGVKHARGPGAGLEGGQGGGEALDADAAAVLGGQGQVQRHHLLHEGREVL